VHFFATAAAAQAAGYRACKRCRPDATPGSPEWDSRADLVGRAMRLIADGVVDRSGVKGLADRLGYSERHVNRQLLSAVGAGPLALARAGRAQTARILLETTSLPINSVAFASGFQSVRQFNATIQEVFAMNPTALRARIKREGDRVGYGGAISLRLPYRAPLDHEGLISFLGARAVTGVEEATPAAYRRSLRLPHGTGIVELCPTDDYVEGHFWLEDLRDLGPAIARSRVLLDLDSDPQTVTDALGEDALLGALVNATPGLRVPGHVDPHELAVRAVLGQQVTVRGATTLAERLVQLYGEQLEHPLGGVTHAFPAVATLADADLGRLGMPGARGRCLSALVTALASGEIQLDAGSERAETRAQLMALPGIGPWTVEYIAMRGLRDPDAFLASDLGVRRALEQLGHDGRPVAVETLSQRWRPYRAYALQHLWGTLAPVRAQARPSASATSAQPLAA
jgi:AraC family transcriptional regulator, regulatory protein of adaptative response / DNA-3-methyladenine glycosylase II